MRQKFLDGFRIENRFHDCDQEYRYFGVAAAVTGFFLL
jgi:hypothetical protein